jgi:hypothetical protein
MIGRCDRRLALLKCGLRTTTFLLAALAAVLFGPSDAGARYRTTCMTWVGVPDHPNAKTLPCNLVIIDANTILVSEMKFSRLSPEPVPFTLSGRWTSSDYSCPDVKGAIVEALTIVQTGEAYEATKLTGDHCVTSGHVSFFGRIEVDSRLAERASLILAGRPEAAPEIGASAL